MTPLEAITAATSRPGHLLAPDIGALLPGYHADIILVKGDVLVDINCCKTRSTSSKMGLSTSDMRRTDRQPGVVVCGCRAQDYRPHVKKI